MALTVEEKREQLNLELLPGPYCIMRLEPGEEVPPILSRTFISISRSEEELSIVCPSDILPPENAERDDHWCCLRIPGELDFSLVGVLASVSGILAETGIPLLVISTYNTDYFLIKQENLPLALECLQKAGFRISGVPWTLTGETPAPPFP